MENSSRNGRGSQLQSLRRRSGYEPSDAETDYIDTPWHGFNKKNEILGFEEPKISRSNSKSPYKQKKDNDNSARLLTTCSELSDVRKNISPFSKSEHPRYVSPYKFTRDDTDLKKVGIVSSNRMKKDRYYTNDASKVSEKSNYSHRSKSAPRPRSREGQKIKCDHKDEKNMGGKGEEASQNTALSVGEINELVANARISRGPVGNAPNLESTESISAGDIFFSQNYAALATKKNTFPNKGSKPKTFTDRNPDSEQRNKAKGSFSENNPRLSSSSVASKTTTTNSSVLNGHSRNTSDASRIAIGSSKKFANRLRLESQTEKWVSCFTMGLCTTPKGSPDKERAFGEALFIEKALVVESLKQFWADRHQPASLNDFICHKKEAQLLNQLVSQEGCPDILFKGPHGSGKKALMMALLREIYGDSALSISHNLRYFQTQETSPMQVVVPVTSSAHHVELNVYLEPNARYALMGLVKQINSNYAVPPEISKVNFKADYTVLVLYDVDKAAESIQHLIKWIMDCYTDACKLILCCEDDGGILEPVKDRCKVLKIDAPASREIVEVLIQIATKEEFDLSKSFAAKIAAKSKQNLRKAIMALEACKAHNYPFAEDQPIPMGWEEVLVELAAEVLADPSPKRLFFIRGKIQKLLVDFVHPKLILQKLVEQFLKGVPDSLKREVYYWHAYYDKRLPMGTSALLKLEEFVAKFMSISRRHSSNRQ